MLKKKLLLILLPIIFMVGCSSKDTLSMLNPTEQKLLWHQVQKKRFGSYDYNNVSKKEIDQVMSDKFHLKIPAFHQNMVKILDTYFLTNEQIKSELYRFSVNEREAVYITAYTYKKADQPIVKTSITLTYTYDVDKKIVYLSRQEVKIQNLLPTSHRKDFDKTATNLSKDLIREIELTGVADQLSAWEKDRKKTGDSSSVIFSNEQKKNFKHIQQIVELFQDKSVVSEIVAVIKDQTITQGE